MSGRARWTARTASSVWLKDRVRPLDLGVGTLGAVSRRRGDGARQFLFPLPRRHRVQPLVDPLQAQQRPREFAVHLVEGVPETFGSVSEFWAKPSFLPFRAYATRIVCEEKGREVSRRLLYGFRPVRLP